MQTSNISRDRRATAERKDRDEEIGGLYVDVVGGREDC